MSVYKRINTVDRIALAKAVSMTSGTKLNDRRSWRLKSLKTFYQDVDANAPDASRITVNVLEMEKPVGLRVDVKDARTSLPLTAI